MQWVKWWTLKICPCPNTSPENVTLFGKKGPCRCNEVNNDLGDEISLDYPGWILNPMMSVLMRNRGEDMTEKLMWRWRHIVLLMQPHTEECPESLKTWRGMEKFSPKAFRGSVVSLTLDFGLLASRTMTEYIFLCGFKQQSLICYSYHKKPTHMWLISIWTRAWTRFSDSQPMALFPVSRIWVQIKNMISTSGAFTTQWCLTREEGLLPHL